MTSFASCRLYAFVDTAYLRGRTPADVAQQLCDGGADLIQLRAKTSPKTELQWMAQNILPITSAAGVGLVINDYPEIALQLGADCVHLGQEDFFDATHTHATEVTGAPKRIALGLSTHSPEQARRALNAAPDYVAVGPVFPTPTKPGRPGVTLDYVRWASVNVNIPWFAIGGISLENLDDVLVAGARRVCVVSAILNAPDIAQACQQFKERLLSVPF